MQREFNVSRSALTLNYTCLAIFCLILLLVIIGVHWIFKIVFAAILVLLVFDCLSMPYGITITQDNNIAFKSFTAYKIIKPEDIIKISKSKMNGKIIYIKCRHNTFKMFKDIDGLNHFFEFVEAGNPTLQKVNL